MVDHLLVAAAVLVIAGLESVTGDQLEVSGLFLFPVVWMTRRRGTAMGALWSAAVSLVWFAVDRWLRPDEWSTAVLVLNQLVRLLVNLTVVWLVSSLDRARVKAEQASETDMLTGLMNRRGFWAAAERELGRQQRTGSPITTACLDLDGFKALNDSRGHEAGDEALRAVARVLRAQLRGSDLTARLGGDEFVVLLPGTTAEQARPVLERLHGALREALAETSPDLGVSVGVVCSPKASRSLDELLRHADAAMYAAKRGGRNRLEFGTPRAVLAS